MKSAISTVDAKSLMYSNCRFDLIFKYLLCEAILGGSKSEIDFFQAVYLESIRAFNNFQEQMPRKKCQDDFLNALYLLLENMRKIGYEQTYVLPVSEGLELQDGAHRVTVAASLGLSVPVKVGGAANNYDYKTFIKNAMDPDWMDYGALRMLELNPRAYVVNLHSVVPLSKDIDVEKILNSNGFVFYKKNVSLSMNGYVNLKKLSYGVDSSEHAEPWVGDYNNGFAGARKHAAQSFFEGRPLRLYVYIADAVADLRQVKSEIRDLLGIGNIAVHINDSKSEALALGQALLNERSVDLLNLRPYDLNTEDLDSEIERLKCLCRTEGFDLSKFALSGSGVLAAHGLRPARDCDLVHAEVLPDKFVAEGFSSHQSQKDFYGHEFGAIVSDPKYHLYYRGVKFVSLLVIHTMKCNRNESPKDIRDLNAIDALCNGEKPKYKEAPLSEKSFIFGALRKEKFASYRTIRIFGQKVFTYRIRARR